ncbi:hypothetical protein IFM89_022066 [Coptis chinensis]|uniref:Pectinesterase n=1 Tax=Coptis chinensis TaxID=261450 RepID=A0A835H7X9_9MAGN|nr:hypothetical protein IFM89_022066 [Coptis chinensis]
MSLGVDAAPPASSVRVLVRFQPDNCSRTLVQEARTNYFLIPNCIPHQLNSMTPDMMLILFKSYFLIASTNKKKKWNLMMIGDGMDATIISGNQNFINGWTTFRFATFAVSAKGFIARDISFENMAGPEKHQPVTVRSNLDLSTFYRCGFRGYQDTLYARLLCQFYRECRITGTIDYIFGNAVVVFQNCQILAKKGLPNKKNTITAQGFIHFRHEL